MRLIRALFLLTITATASFAVALWQTRPLIWSQERQITRGSGDSRLVDISADPTGRLVYLVWEDTRDGAMEVYFKRSTNSGLSWEPDVRVSNLTPLTLDPEPRLATDGQNILILFANRTATGENLFYVVSRNEGANFSRPVELRNEFGDESNPAVATAGSDVHLVWQGIADGGEHIFYSRSKDFGRTWQTAVPLANDTVSQDQYPEITAVGDKVYVTWVRMYEGSEAVFVRVSLNSGAMWQREVQVSSYQMQAYPEFPAIASNGTYAYLVWGTPNGILYSRSQDSGETWANPIALTNASRQFVAPRISVAMSKIQIVTAGIAGPPSQLSDIFYVSSSDGGETWSQVLAMTTHGQETFALAPTIWSNGVETFVAWEDNRNGPFAIFFLSQPDLVMLRAFEWRLVISGAVVLAAAATVYLGLELSAFRQTKRRRIRKNISRRRNQYIPLAHRRRVRRRR